MKSVQVIHNSCNIILNFRSSTTLITLLSMSHVFMRGKNTDTKWRDVVLSSKEIFFGFDNRGWELVRELWQKTNGYWRFFFFLSMHEIVCMFCCLILFSYLLVLLICCTFNCLFKKTNSRLVSRRSWVRIPPESHVNFFPQTLGKHWVCSAIHTSV